MMRRRTWISLWDALGYLAWGFGWVMSSPAQGDNSTHPRRRDER